MKIPTVHMNGTSSEALVSQIAEAHYAIEEAIGELRAAAPNGRDYYPQGPDAITDALREHKARVAKLREVQDELTAIIEGIREQRR